MTESLIATRSEKGLLAFPCNRQEYDDGSPFPHADDVPICWRPMPNIEALIPSAVFFCFLLSALSCFVGWALGTVARISLTPISGPGVT